VDQKLDVKAYVRGLGQAARAAARALARADTAAKNRALEAMAAAMRASAEARLAPNRDDVAQAQKDGRDAALLQHHNCCFGSLDFRA
jgi:glutamate-5-semialdehyde dehydrogenase